MTFICNALSTEEAAICRNILTTTDHISSCRGLERQILNENALLRALYSNVSSRLARRSMRSVVHTKKQEWSRMCSRRLGELEKRGVRCIDMLKLEEDAARSAGDRTFKINDASLQYAAKFVVKAKKLRRDMLKI